MRTGLFADFSKVGMQSDIDTIHMRKVLGPFSKIIFKCGFYYLIKRTYIREGIIHGKMEWHEHINTKWIGTFYTFNKVSLKIYKQ